MAKKENSLAHTKWMCQYHIVFTPKYRRKVIYNQYKENNKKYQLFTVYKINSVGAFDLMI